MKVRAGSMFAGIGGICLGFKQAGAEIVWANDIDKYACATYRHNFGSSYLVEADIRTVDANSIPDIDVLTAGFPCQPFSVMGTQKGFADPRGTMYYEILRVIDAKLPQIVFLENVKNLIKHDKGRTFLTIHSTLAQRGYAVKYGILGANTHANIPQLRDRIFVAAFLDYNKMVRFAFPDELPQTTAINDIIDRSAIVDKSYYYQQINRYYAALNERISDNTAIYRIDDSGIAIKAWDICPTLKANMGTYRDRVPIIRDDYGIRKLTPVECLALQGYPDTYNFPDIPRIEKYKQIGNTVCVPVVKRIADNLLRLFSINP
jgi:DNA (cytosine-5)-methyltransferase 1